MKWFLVMLWMCGLSVGLTAQSFEVSGLQETYHGVIGETIKVPLTLKNTSDKTITVLIRKSGGQIGSSQKNYFCHNGRCLDQRIEDYIVRLEPGTVLQSFTVALEAGFVPGISTVKYQVYDKSTPSEPMDIEMSFLVEEEMEKKNIYASRHIKFKDLYPNPVKDVAFVDYLILEEQIKAKIVIHNVLGSAVQEFDLPSFENTVKFNTSTLSPGIYFYTLYIDETAVMSRKLIVDSK